MPSFASWCALWERFGVRSGDARLYEEVSGCYRQPHRRYHTLQHLDESLEQMALARAVAEHPAEVELALWFHDAVFELDRDDCERRSADWAARALRDAGVDGVQTSRVQALILGTRLGARPDGIDGKLVADVDLVSLAAPHERFAECERQLREERPDLGDEAYRRQRRRALEAFLARQRIYRTDVFREAFERKARRNIRARLRRL